MRAPARDFHQKGLVKGGVRGNDGAAGLKTRQVGYMGPVDAVRQAWMRFEGLEGAVFMVDVLVKRGDIQAVNMLCRLQQPGTAVCIGVEAVYELRQQRFRLARLKPEGGTPPVPLRPLAERRFLS